MPKSGFYYKIGNLPELSNLPASCSTCIDKAGKKPQVVNCDEYRQKRRQQRWLNAETNEDYYFCSSEKLQSTRLFKEKMVAQHEAASSASLALSETSQRLQTQSKRYLHNVVQLNAQSLQSIYATIGQETFEQNSREELLANVRQQIEEDTDNTVKLIIDLLKNENLKKTELNLHDKLFYSKEPQLLNYSIHKIILLILNNFWDDFRDKSIKVHVGNCYQRVKVDFDSLASVLTHIFHNAAKYVLPGSHITVGFRSDEKFMFITFEMISLQIGEDEISRIFDEGFSGARPQELGRQGKGLGLWVAQQLLQEMAGDIEVNPNIDPTKCTQRMGITYEKNQFVLKLLKT